MAFLLVLLDRGVDLDVLLELLVRDVREDLLAVGADHRRRSPSVDASTVRRSARRPSSPAAFLAAGLLGGAAGAALVAAAFLAGAFLAAAFAVAVLRAVGRGRCSRHRHATEMPRPARCASRALRCRGLDRGGVVTGAAHVLGLTRRYDVFVGRGDAGPAIRRGARAPRREASCARSRTRTPLGQGTSGRGRARCRQEPRRHSATPLVRHRTEPTRPGRSGIRPARPQPSPPPWRPS